MEQKLINGSEHWAHNAASAIIDNTIGWDEDRTELLRAITNELNKTFDDAHSSGEKAGYQNAVWQMFNFIREQTERSPAARKEFVDWCRLTIERFEDGVGI